MDSDTSDEENLEQYEWVIVTGASSGLGKAICKTVSKKEFNVLVTGRNEQIGQANVSTLKKELKDHLDDTNCQIKFQTLDMAELSSIRSFVELIEQRKFLIRAIINNAVGDFDSKTQSGMDSSFAVGFVGPYYLMNLIIPYLRRQKVDSKIINIGCREYKQCPQIDMAYVRRQAKLLNTPGTLQITIERAANLAAIALRARASVFVRVTFGNRPPLETRTIGGGNALSWNQHFTLFDVGDLDGTIGLELVDRGPLGSDVVIGVASVPLSGLSRPDPASREADLRTDIGLIRPGSKGPRPDTRPAPRAEAKKADEAVAQVGQAARPLTPPTYPPTRTH